MRERYIVDLDEQSDRWRTCEGVREIRAIEMFANESIMTPLMAITRVYRGNNVRGDFKRPETE